MEVDLTNLITAVGGLLFGGSGIGVFMHYKANKKSKEIDNETKEIANESKSSDEWIKLYDKLQEEKEKERIEFLEKLEKKDLKIEKLYTEKGKDVTTIIKLRARLTRYSVLYSLTRCDTINCSVRKPPLTEIELSDPIELITQENDEHNSKTEEK